MDNLTHTLVGLALAKPFEKKNSDQLAGLTITSIIASNLPDLDFLYAKATRPEHLGFILHHRGWTHTFLAVLPLSLILSVVIWLAYSRFGRVRPAKIPWWKLWLVALFGLLLHIGADSLNSYGIHAMSPFNNRWFFGDTLFILEPLIWLSFFPFLFFILSKSRIVRGLSLLFFAGSILLVTRFGALPPVMVAADLVWPLIWICVLWNRRIRFRYALSLLPVSLVVILFAVAHHQAEQKLSEMAWAQNPEGRIDDVVLSPMPANPICWSFIWVEELGPERQKYRVSFGSYTLWPTLFKPDVCAPPAEPVLKINVHSPTSDPLSESLSRIHWWHRQSYSISDLQELNHNCLITDFLKFSRVPQWFVTKKQIIMYDGRFSSTKNFATIVVDRNVLSKSATAAPRSAVLDPQECPKHVPPWKPPRDDLLQLSL